MKKTAITILAGLIAMAAVPAFAWVGTADLGSDSGGPLTPTNQTGIRTLDPDTLYTIKGLYYVEDGAEIHIPAGTTIYGVPAATLVIKTGGKVYATGEQFNPIVMTSSEVPGNRFPGDWGGVVILGLARVNKTDPQIEGGIIDATYGGTDDNDSSGVFKYVRIEFPGYRFALNNEINGLTMGGVGAGTELHHVQVSYSFDDSFEWFGGAVDAHHLVALGGTDDEFDTDFGFRGRMQFLFGLRDPDFSDPQGSSNGFESDNDSGGTFDMPLTMPIISNATLVGPEHVVGVGNLPIGNTFSNSGVLRKNSRISIFNTVIAGYPKGMTVREGSIPAAEIDTLRFYDNEVTGHSEYTPGNIHDTGRWPGIGVWFDANANDDTLSRSHTAVGLGDMSSLIAPNPIPQAGSPLIGTAIWTNSYLTDNAAYFDEVSYRGAFDPALPWTQQWAYYWTNFDPQNTDYTVSAVEDSPELPSFGRLAENYPNPFNPSTKIRFSVPKAGHVTLDVFDVRGNKVANLHDGDLGVGSYDMNFNGNGLSSGTYFYRLTGNGFSFTEKMQLVK
jgi:hypothetical protein